MGQFDLNLSTQPFRGYRLQSILLSIALAALDEAEQAALEAWLARYDANAAQARSASHASA